MLYGIKCVNSVFLYIKVQLCDDKSEDNICVLPVYCLPFFPVYSVGIVIMLLLSGGLNPRTIVLNPPGGTSSYCLYFSWLK